MTRRGFLATQPSCAALPELWAIGIAKSYCRRGLTAAPFVKPDPTALKNKLAQYKAFASKKK